MQKPRLILKAFVRTCFQLSLPQQQQQCRHFGIAATCATACDVRNVDVTTTITATLPQAAIIATTTRTLNSCVHEKRFQAKSNSLPVLPPMTIAGVYPQYRRRLAPSPAPPTTNGASTSNSACLLASASASVGLAVRSYSKFTVGPDPPRPGTQPLSDQRAHELISNLKDSERAAIKAALEKFEALKQKEGFEGKLAATQWRTRFGRLSKVPALGSVDPTGTFCAFPDDWLKKKMAEKAKEPASADLRKIFFVNAVPFIAFGFLDNFVMIVAGDSIEHLFGTFMCISTLAAAGLGNTVSDVLGIGSAYYVERGCEVMGLKPPDLTPVQMEMKSSRRSANMGRIIGITVGCLLGMFPLLYIDSSALRVDELVEPPTSTASCA